MLPLDAYDREDLHNKRPTLSRSYGSKLQSSFAWDLSNAFVFSTRSPVSVCGTDQYASSLSSFSCEQGIMKVTLSGLSYVCAISLHKLPTPFDRNPMTGFHYPSPPLHRSTHRVLEY
jgi:hypothetical protein